VSHDPFKICSDITCPHCGVKGRIVSEQETRYFDDEHDDFDLLTCVECGGLHESHGFSGDEHLKAMRIQYGRLIEKRPYEPPKQDAAWLREQQAKTGATMASLAEMFKQVYGPMVVKDIEDRVAKAEAWSLPQGTVTVTPIFGAGQHLHNFTCSMWQWPPGACSCGAGDE
jgi:hypothetical protein